MSKGAVSFNESNVEYYTPKYIVDRFGPFDYDPATTPAQAEYLGIPNYDTKETDGLFSDWTQYRRIWINPPFNIKHLFIEKAAATYAKSKNDIFMLLPVQTLTAGYFHATMDGLLGGGKDIYTMPAHKIYNPHWRDAITSLRVGHNTFSR